ncbi:hypothetical protein Neosp_014873 [[Neocosmospora] mangrovei]
MTPMQSSVFERKASLSQESGTTTTAVGSTTSTETSSATAESTTSTVTAESSTETSVSSTDTQSSVEISTSSTSTETSASATTDFTTTTGDMTASTTSTAPTVTFSIVAAGSGPVQGNGLQTYPNPNSVALFRTDIGGGDSVRPFHLDAEGRLINDQGFYLCGYYDAYGENLDAPAEVITCNDEYPLIQAFLKCQQTVGLKLTCSIPAITCVPGDPNDFDETPTCEAAAGTWDNLYTSESGPGIALFIGIANAESYYDPVELGVQVV